MAHTFNISTWKQKAGGSLWVQNSQRLNLKKPKDKNTSRTKKKLKNNQEQWKKINHTNKKKLRCKTHFYLRQLASERWRQETWFKVEACLWYIVSWRREGLRSGPYLKISKPDNKETQYNKNSLHRILLTPLKIPPFLKAFSSCDNQNSSYTHLSLKASGIF